MMRLQAFAIYGLLTVTALSASPKVLGQTSPFEEGSPGWVVDQFFVQRSFPDLALYVNGEMKEESAAVSTFGSTLPAGAIVTVRLLDGDSSSAVWSVFARDSSGGIDLYAFLYLLDDVWKLTAVRSLALPPLYYMFMDSLSAIPTPPDSVRSLLARLRLAADSDSSLRAYFTVHQDDLNRIAAVFARDTVRSLAAVAGTVDTASMLRDIPAQLASLDLSGVYRHEQYPRCVFVEVGGMLDNEVGFLFVPEGCSPPEMSPGGFICIDPLSGGWYLYKTT